MMSRPKSNHYNKVIECMREKYSIPVKYSTRRTVLETELLEIKKRTDEYLQDCFPSKNHECRKQAHFLLSEIKYALDIISSEKIDEEQFLYIKACILSFNDMMRDFC